MNNKAMEMFVIGGTIYEEMDATQQAWISMMEDVLLSNNMVSVNFQEFAETSNQLCIGLATRKQLKTVWWNKYQELVKEVMKDIRIGVANS